MRYFLKVFVALIASCLPALAQAPIHQSGNATPGHALYFVTNGIAGDAGTAVNGFLTSVGVTASGDAICQNSAGPTSAGWQRICLGVTTAGGADIIVQNFGTAPAQPLTLNLNGSVYQFPFTLPGTGIIGPGTTVIGDFAEWANTIGTLLKDVTPTAALDQLCSTNANVLIRLSGTWQCGATGTSGHVIPFLDGNNTWSGTSTFTGDIIGPLTITPAANSTNQGFNISQSSGTGSVVGPLSFNEIDVLDNSTVTGGATQVAGLRINYNVGGAGVTTGPRIAAYFNMLDSITGTGTADKIGAVGSCDVTVADTSGGGGCYGLNAFAGVAATGSTSRLIGFESDVTIATGGTATNRYAFSAVNVAPGNGQGSTLDSVMFVANFVAAGAFKNFLVLSNAYGFAPLTTTANLFSSDTAFTINDIFHFANATINGDIINSPNVILTGAGALTLLGGVSNPTGNGQGSFGASATGGVTLIGQGSSFDYVFYNSAGNAVCSVATGTRTQNCNTVGSTNPFIFNGTPGITQTCTVNQAKTLVFTGGILTSGSCNS